MRRPKLWWISLLGLVLLAAPGCTDSNLDDPDTGNVVLQVITLDNPSVQGDTQLGTCTVTGAQCLDNSDCDAFDPLDVCFIDPAAAECVIEEWNATLGALAKTELANSSPFNDAVMVDVTVTYEWLNGFSMSPYTVPLSGTIPAGGTAQVTFFPMSSEDLAALRAAFPLVARTANVTLRFRAKVEDGTNISVAQGAQLFVEACN